MSHNTFGHLFRVTTWGESHGPAIGCVIDGCPPGLVLERAFIQSCLDRRRPGTSRFVTQRREPDQVEILSGIFADRDDSPPVTTGTPISLMVRNVDHRPGDYAAIAAQYRPGHADYVYDQKYGLRDPRGGGRSSARETAMRVAAGAVARRVLGEDITIRGAVIQIGAQAIDPARWDWQTARDNPFWCPDAIMAKQWAAYLDTVREAGSSLGALIEIQASGVPPGWGAPLYGKLDAELAGAMMGINAVKGVEIGSGFQAVTRRGEDNADAMRMDNGGVRFLSNNNGGIAGGLSTGQDIIIRVVVKPTSSINRALPSVTQAGEEADICVTGRHDPCIGIRAVPVAEAMMACVLADARLRHRGQTGR